MENNTFENDVVAETPQQPPKEQPAERKVDFNAMADKVTDKAKSLANGMAPLWEKVKTIPKKIWIMAGAAAAAVVVLIIVLSLLGNTYKTPVKAIEKLLNYNSIEKIVDKAPSILNGFGEKEAKKLLDIVEKSDQYEDAMETAEDYFDDAIESLEDEYGKNYKIRLKVEDKEKLEKEDVKEFRNKLRDIADFSKELDDMDSDDYEDMADEIGITKSKAKEMVKTLKSFCKLCKSADVTKGYELSVIVTITGSEVDEPMEEELTLYVYKVDGRWVLDVFSLMGGFYPGMLPF